MEAIIARPAVGTTRTSNRSSRSQSQSASDAQAPAAHNPAPNQIPEADWRELARQANLEIEKLAEAMITISEASGDDDYPITHGIMTRIMVLNQIIFHSAQLHGNDRGAWHLGADDQALFRDLKDKFKGAA